MTVEVADKVAQEQVAPVETVETPVVETQVETVAEEAKQTPVEAPKELPTSQVEKVEKLLVDANVDIKAVTKAMLENEGKLTPDLMQALVEKHGESVASLLGLQLETIHKEQIAKTDKANAVVYDFVAEQFKDVTEQSGADTWKELSTWAKASVPSSERSEINAMLAQGGLAAKLAIKELADAFKESQGMGEQEAQLETGDGFGTSTRGAITKDEYARELRVLMEDKNLGYDSREVVSLQARRQKGIARGM